MSTGLEPMRLATVGEFELYQVPEITIPTSVRWLLPGITPEAMEEATAALDPAFFGENGRLVQSIHTYLLRSARRVVLIDTGVGNGKSRGGGIPAFDMLDTPFLARLERVGVRPEDVDLVLCTHMHTDHLGWDAKREGDAWVPTFPRARHLFVRKEYEAFRASTEQSASARTMWEDTVEPLVRAGLIDLVEADERIDEAIQLEPSHGHSPGHVNVVVESGGATAAFIGDVMHNPIQVAVPEMASALNGPEAATQTRIELIRRYADTGIAVFGAHFSWPCGGYIRSVERGYRFEPIQAG